jgi:hypothetical protein
MARKRAPKAVATREVREVRTGRPVRLDLSEADHERLEHQAKKRGLNKAAFARMAVLDRLRQEETEGAGK